jgi:hypothetical protein
MECKIHVSCNVNKKLLMKTKLRFYSMALTQVILYTVNILFTELGRLYRHESSYGSLRPIRL